VRLPLFFLCLVDVAGKSPYRVRFVGHSASRLLSFTICFRFGCLLHPSWLASEHCSSEVAVCSASPVTLPLRTVFFVFIAPSLFRLTASVGQTREICNETADELSVICGLADVTALIFDSREFSLTANAGCNISRLAGTTTTREVVINRTD
jgi:hypothetical protein